MANDANQLADYDGKFKLAVDWAKNVLKQMSWKTCTKMKVDPGQTTPEGLAML